MPRTRKVNENRKATAVAKLTEMSEARKTAEKAAERKRHVMYKGMLKAFNAGMTYDEIADVTGLSKIRVSQVLAEQRNGAGA